MTKAFNSKTAQLLAKKFNLTLEQINTTRKNNKVTIKNVRDAHKKIKNKEKEKSEISQEIKSSKKNQTRKNQTLEKSKSICGYNVTLTIEPTISEIFKETNSNMNQFKIWILDRIYDIKSKYFIQNEDIKIINNKTLELNFKIMNSSKKQLNLTINSITDLDKDKKYPIYTDEIGNIYLSEKSTPVYNWGYGPASLYPDDVIIKVIKKNISNITK